MPTRAAKRTFIRENLTSHIHTRNTRAGTLLTIFILLIVMVVAFLALGKVSSIITDFTSSNTQGTSVSAVCKDACKVWEGDNCRTGTMLYSQALEKCDALDEPALKSVCSCPFW